jgi:hypothetical protein
LFSAANTIFLNKNLSFSSKFSFHIFSKIENTFSFGHQSWASYSSKAPYLNQESKYFGWIFVSLSFFRLSKIIFSAIIKKLKIKIYKNNIN